MKKFTKLTINIPAQVYYDDCKRLADDFNKMAAYLRDLGKDTHSGFSASARLTYRPSKDDLEWIIKADCPKTTERYYKLVITEEE